jgi:hypothetical protein
MQGEGERTRAARECKAHSATFHPMNNTLNYAGRGRADPRGKRVQGTQRHISPYEQYSELCRERGSGPTRQESARHAAPHFTL